MKRKGFIILIIIVSIWAVCLSSREAVCEEDYQQLLARVKNFEKTVDFKQLRLSYAKTADYNPYGSDENSKDVMFTALKEDDFKKAIEHAQTILEKNYVDIDAHFVSQIAFRQIGDQKKYEFHQLITKGLIDSILNSGDGLKPETALQVICVREEYIVLNVLGFTLKQQKTLESGGHKYDQLDVVYKKNGRSGSLYFNVDIPFGWLNKSLKK